jgi:hypothetical protein
MGLGCSGAGESGAGAWWWDRRQMGLIEHWAGAQGRKVTQREEVGSASIRCLPGGPSWKLPDPFTVGAVFVAFL